MDKVTKLLLCSMELNVGMEQAEQLLRPHSTEHSSTTSNRHFNIHTEMCQVRHLRKELVRDLPTSDSACTYTGLHQALQGHLSYFQSSRVAATLM